MAVRVRRPYFIHDRAALTARGAFAPGAVLGAASIAPRDGGAEADTKSAQSGTMFGPA
jgi:hypothetical protein